MMICEGHNYSRYKFPTQKHWCRWPWHMWTHVLYIHCVVCIFVCFMIFNRFFTKIWKRASGEIGGDLIVVSRNHRDYACGHLPSLSTPKACRIWINEVGMLFGCQKHAGCCLVMPAEYRQLALDGRQLIKFNLENTGQSLMRHQLTWYRVKWAHWQRMTSISLKTTWQQGQYNTIQHV